MTETRELVEALRKIGGHGFPNWADEAANTIKAQAERIEVLEEAARAENERLQTIIDNLHAVEEKHRETANAQFHRVNRLQVEKGRLRGLLAEAIQWNWNDFEEVPTESSEACLPLLVDLHQRIKSALAQKGEE